MRNEPREWSICKSRHSQHLSVKWESPALLKQKPEPRLRRGLCSHAESHMVCLIRGKSLKAERCKNATALTSSYTDKEEEEEEEEQRGCRLICHWSGCFCSSDLLSPAHRHRSGTKWLPVQNTATSERRDVTHQPPDTHRLTARALHWNTEGLDSPQPSPIAQTTPFSRKTGLQRYSRDTGALSVFTVHGISMTDQLHALGCSSKSFKLYSPKEPPNGSAFPPFHPGTMLDRDVGPTPMYPPTYLEPGIGRHTPYGNQTDYRIFELNKRLQNWTEECDNLWWDAFTTEFFEDDAMLTITFCLEDGPKRYTIGRTLIPRYFRSVFEGGATELYYVLKHPKESFHNNFVSLDCDQCTMVTQNGKPMFTQVCVEGRLYLEFMFDDMMRIKTWHFSIRQHRELIPRSILAMHAQDPQMLDQLSKNITRCGLSNSTLNYLRVRTQHSDVFYSLHSIRYR
ncbi:hypothetical protein QQF64_003323, partial [Cirrhinus molitorella]